MKSSRDLLKVLLPNVGGSLAEKLMGDDEFSGDVDG